MKLAFFFFFFLNCMWFSLDSDKRDLFYPPVQMSTQWQKRMSHCFCQNSADLLDPPQKGSQALPKVLRYTLRTNAVDKAVLPPTLDLSTSCPDRGAWWRQASTRQGNEGLDFVWGVAHWANVRWTFHPVGSKSPWSVFSLYVWLETFNVTFIVWLDCPKQSPKNFPHQRAIATMVFSF